MNKAKANLDLHAYLARINYTQDISINEETLHGLHLAHTSAIPFENIDVLLGRSIKLDIASLQEKLVFSQRGGYCFEQNIFFAAILEEIGFTVRRLAARVRYGVTETLARTHMMLLVEVDKNCYLVDVGFGRDGLLLPVPFEEKCEVSHYAWSYRLTKEGESWVLQTVANDLWQDMYAFTLEPQLVVDYEMASHYVSTHPSSPFSKSLIVQKPTAKARYKLTNMELQIDDGKSQTKQILNDDTELLFVLANIFGISLPKGTKFNIPRN